jgi:hypothetical protein
MAFLSNPVKGASFGGGFFVVTIGVDRNATRSVTRVEALPHRCPAAVEGCAVHLRRVGSQALGPEAIAFLAGLGLLIVVTCRPRRRRARGSIA